MRVATWNLLHGLDIRTGRIDLGAVAAAIDALDVDVLAVQEVDREQRRSGRVDQVADLAGRLGWHGVFAPALLGEPARRWHARPGDGTDPGGPAYGIGLLSRHPLLCPERTALYGGGEDAGRALPGWDHEPRTALRAQVVPPAGRPLVVATAHLSYLVWRGVRQLHHAASWTAACGLPAVLIGDLNLPLRLLRPAIAGTGWLVAAATATFPAWRPGMQLDHLLGRGTRLRGVRVGPRGPSDHLPVTAQVVPA